jgi:HSP20 family molecular chaperone IbpA
MRRNIRLTFRSLLLVTLVPAIVWAYDDYGYPGNRGYQPYPGWANSYQQPRSLRIQKGMTEEGYYVYVYLQGLQADDVQVFVQRNRLVLQSVQDDEYGQFSPSAGRVSRSYRRFRKQLRLPYDADGSRMTKTTRNGSLEIYIPRVRYPMPSEPFPEQRRQSK